MGCSLSLRVCVCERGAAASFRGLSRSATITAAVVAIPKTATISKPKFIGSVCSVNIEWCDVFECVFVANMWRHATRLRQGPSRGRFRVPLAGVVRCGAVTVFFLPRLRNCWITICSPHRAYVIATFLFCQAKKSGIDDKTLSCRCNCDFFFIARVFFFVEFFCIILI